MGINCDIIYSDGFESFGTVLQNWGGYYSLSVDNAYFIVPHADVTIMVHPLDEFMKAQEKARMSDVDKELENCRKALAPKHQADGFTWTEI